MWAHAAQKIKEMVASNEGALHNPMKLGLGDTQTHRHLHKPTPNPVTMVTKTRGTARAQVMSQGEGVEDRITRHDGDPVTRGMTPGTDPEPTVGDQDDDDDANEGDPLRIRPLQEHRRIGTPNSPRWRMTTDEGERGGTIDERGGTIDERGGTIDERGGTIDETRRPNTSESS